jgi:hypothetical protein
MLKHLMFIYYKSKYGQQVAETYRIFGGRIVSVTRDRYNTNITLRTQCDNELEYVENTKD